MQPWNPQRWHKPTGVEFAGPIWRHWTSPCTPLLCNGCDFLFFIEFLGNSLSLPLWCQGKDEFNVFKSLIWAMNAALLGDSVCIKEFSSLTLSHPLTSTESYCFARWIPKQMRRAGNTCICLLRHETHIYAPSRRLRQHLYVMSRTVNIFTGLISMPYQ